MNVLWDSFQCWTQKHDVPDRIAVLLKDLIAFRRKSLHIRECSNNIVSRDASGYMNILYHIFIRLASLGGGPQAHVHVEGKKCKPKLGTY